MMRVGDRNLGTTAAADAAKAQETQRSGASGSQREKLSGISDRVQLSSVAGSLSQAVQASAQERSARVAELTAQFQSGSYRPDAAGAASGMVSEAMAGA
jgi:flagellar biosynthesis anti-sigma factor FlgM